MTTQHDKAVAFRALHAGPGAFVIPNPWDVGSARLLEQAGFRALATSSAGFAFTLGKPDGSVGRDAMLEHAAALSAGVALPISGDLENGFGDAPAFVAETVRLAAVNGLVGCSIEDATGRPGEPIYPFDVAVERVRAAAEAARSLPFPFTLTARAENWLHGRPDLADTIARLQAFQDAGAHVLFAPGLQTIDDIATVVRAVDRPVNAIAGSPSVPLTVASLATVGVRRISIGSALARTAIGATLAAIREMAEHGTFDYASGAVLSKDVNAMFSRRQPIHASSGSGEA